MYEIKLHNKNSKTKLGKLVKFFKNFKYLKNAINYGIKFIKNKNIEAYTDADNAGDEETRRLTFKIFNKMNALNIIFGTSAS
ncbi:hypothetical protein PIROE2DRAFT_1575 [Piromyces sp. E2]|nr:hypothetical protein PIROE2DRAFT_1575 [Piromyces sp. E2]|eukprot:OUM70409.1 hypothetical protein PIROE2DRAFT_1575 [Piromyces sp. E2]